MYTEAVETKESVNEHGKLMVHKTDFWRSLTRYSWIRKQFIFKFENVTESEATEIGTSMEISTTCYYQHITSLLFSIKYVSNF